MQLPAGTRMGPYEVIAPLGAGGMGEVYRARDTQLSRDVALKVLPALLASDPERLARFEREAQMLAALNHSNIAQIHGIERSTGILAIIMEFVDGMTLDELIHRPSTHARGTGGLTLDDALPIARQLAEALEAAHERGIVHRDLKPANISVRPDGIVKVLDFGLAKVTDPAASPISVDLHNSPTMTGPPSEAGMILGTAAYMAPEQAKGKAVDKRADIWAFGCVLYEMLAGRRVFTGATTSELLAAVMLSDPDFGALPPTTPAALIDLLRRCLEKDPRQRLRDIGEARLLLEGTSLRAAPGAAGPVHRPRSLRMFKVAATILAVTAGVGGYLAGGRGRERVELRAPLTSFSQLTDQPGVERQPTISPDGKTVVFVSAARGNDDLYLLRVGGRKSVLLTEDSAADDYAPAFSSDGQRLAFRSERAGGGIFVMEATGESVRRVTEAGYDPRWSPDGKYLVVADERVGDPMSRARDSILTRVAVADGSTLPIVQADAVGGRWSPTGRRIVYWGRTPDAQRDLWTVAADGSEADAPVRLTNDAAVDWSPTWSPDGRYVYFASSRGGTMNLWRIAVDEASGRALAEPEPVTTPTGWSGNFEFAADGDSLVFSDQDERSIIWAVAFDSTTGAPSGPPRQVLQGRAINSIDLSQDGTSIVFSQRGQPWEGLGTVRTDGSGWSRITDDSTYHRLPTWSPDGSRILFYRNRGDQLWSLRPDGSGLTEHSLPAGTGHIVYPVWSYDGSNVALASDSALLLLDLSTSPARLIDRFDRAADDAGMVPFSWSRDGRWLAGNTRYASRHDLLVLDLHTKVQRRLSVNGKSPVWLPDSRRVLYSTPNEIVLLNTQTGSTRPVFALARPIEQWGRSLALSRDGRVLVYLQMQAEGDVWRMTLDNPR